MYLKNFNSSEKLEKLNFEVELKPVFLQSGKEIPEKYAISRTDNNHCFEIVGKNYTPIQNSELIELGELLSDESKSNSYDSRVLKSGSIVALDINLGQISSKDSSPIHRILRLATSHDGSLAYQAQSFLFRQVCKNGLFAKLGNETSKISIKHTKSSLQKLQQAKKILESTKGFFEKFEILSNKMIEKPFNHSQLKQLVEFVLPTPKKAEKPEKKQIIEVNSSSYTNILDEIVDQTSAMDALLSGRPLYPENDISTRLENNRQKIIELFEGSPTIGNEIRGTAWSAYQAVTEYIDHEKSTRGDSENREISAYFGVGASQKEKALEKILELVDLN